MSAIAYEKNSIQKRGALRWQGVFFLRNIYINQKTGSDDIYKHGLRWNRQEERGEEGDGVS